MEHRCPKCNELIDNNDVEIAIAEYAKERRKAFKYIRYVFECSYCGAKLSATQNSHEKTYNKLGLPTCLLILNMIIWFSVAFNFSHWYIKTCAIVFMMLINFILKETMSEIREKEARKHFKFDLHGKSKN